MLMDAPDPVEVANFNFRQVRKLCMNQKWEETPTETINLVATSSKFGLVFVGIQDGFKVLKLEDIFDLSEDDENRKEAKEFPCQSITSPTPCLLALSADDMTLAVCVTRDFCAVADMYDMRAFANQEEMPVPFTSVRLSSDNNVKLRDLMWNPVVVEMYAFCLSDGSVYIHELAETNLKIAANLPPQTSATAVCWSPKGKEVVVGKKNGSFSRFKPTLQEVKNFPPPAGLDENGVEVVSIFWISTTLFAVVYVPAGDSDDKSPSLVFASTPKGADVTYSNFGDVCCGVSCDRQPRYMMHYDPEWKILVCVSSNSIESAVIACAGNDQPIWHQWMLDDAGRADIPLVGHEEPSPLGMAVIYCAQRKIIVSDTESYPPMPVLFLLSSSGLLCPFHMLNTEAGAANLVYPSEPISREGERRNRGNEGSQPVLDSRNLSAPLASAVNIINIVQPHGDTVPTISNNSVVPPMSSTPVSNASVLAAQTSAVQNSQLNSVQTFSAPQTNSFSFISNQNSQKVLPASKIGPSLTFGSPKPPSASSPQAFAALKPFSAIPSSGLNSLQTQAAVTQASSSTVSPPEQSSKKLAPSTITQPVMQTITVVQKSKMPLNSTSASQKPSEGLQATETAWLTESTIINAILEEVAEFNRELQELKEQSAKSEGLIGTKEEMSYLKNSSLSLVEFHQKMNLAIETLNSEVHSLRNMLLESFAMLSDAESQEKRLKDPKYLSMLRERALDPRSAKQMQKIRQLNQYLSTQLTAVNDKLDNDWHEFVKQQQKNHNRRAYPLPSAEAVYRTIVNNQNIMFNLRNQLESMLRTLNRRKREGQLRGAKLFHTSKLEIPDVELGRLADALLQTKINSDDGKVEVEHSQKKTIPLQKQAALRELLANRRITAVKPTVIYSPSQSRLCSTLPLIIKSPEKPPAVETDQTTEKVENVEHPPLQESVPECVHPSLHQEVSVVPPFTAKPASLESKGGITQGIPVAKTLNKPTPSIIPSQALNAGTLSAAFKTVQNGSSEQPSSLLTKNASQSAFTHLVPSASKPVPESPKLLSQNSAAKSPFVGQNFFQQKTVQSSSFMSVSSVRPPPERSFVPAFPLSEPKEAGNANSVFASTPYISTGPDSGSIGSCVYEDISPPDSPQRMGDSGMTVQLMTADQPAMTLTVKDTSEVPAVQPVSEEKLVTKPAGDMKPTSFFFSPVDERKPAVTPVSQKDVPQPNDSGVSSQSTVPKSTEISLTSSPAVISVVSSSDFASGIVTTTSVSQQIQSSVVSQPNIPPASVPCTVVSSSALVMQVLSSPADSVTSPSVPVIQSSPSVIQKESTCVATQAESPFASLKLSVPTNAPTQPPSSQALQSNVGKVAAFSFTLSAKDISIQKEVKSADAVVSAPSNVTSTPPNVTSAPSDVTSMPSNVTSTPSNVTSTPLNATSAPSNITSAPSSVTSAAVSTATSVADQPPPSLADQSASSQKAIFGSVPSATVTSSSTVFGQPPPISCSSTPASTPSVQSVFGQTAAGSSSAGAFGLAATTQPSSFFGQKPVSTASTTSTVSTTTATTTTSTLSFFGQQSTTQSSFFGKSTLTSPVFGQAPQAQTSVFGQTVNSASSSPFGQTGTGSFFNQAAASAGSVFGQKAQSPSGSSAFGQSAGNASGFSFQKASMEQQNSSSFGMTKSVFGQSSVFGQQQQQQTTTSSPFGQSSSSPSGGIFGQGGFFSDLGGKPSEENASKNVFAATVSSSTTSSSIFGNQGASTFGAKLGGSFSGGGSFSSGSGSVAQSGFGAFQQTPQKTGGFGAPPSFGGSPTFGSSPNFGGSPSFGSGLSGAGGNAGLSSPSFGSTQGEGFGSFASSNSPTFGSLASQTGGFGSPAQQQAPTFGSLSPQSPSGAFGASNPVFGGSPGFGTQSSFGSPTNVTQSSAFSQWRN